MVVQAVCFLEYISWQPAGKKIFQNFIFPSEKCAACSSDCCQWKFWKMKNKQSKTSRRSSSFVSPCRSIRGSILFDPCYQYAQL